MNSSWFVYLLRCSDSSLYCGITNNLANRVLKHNLGKGAKYTRSKLPVNLVWSYKVDTKSVALKLEYRVRKLSWSEKMKLVVGQREVPSIN